MDTEIVRDWRQLERRPRLLLEAIAKVYFDGDVDRAWAQVLDDADNHPPIRIHVSQAAKMEMRFKVPHSK